MDSEVRVANIKLKIPLVRRTLRLYLRPKTATVLIANTKFKKIRGLVLISADSLPQNYMTHDIKNL